jgi:prophage regulatory protein
MSKNEFPSQIRLGPRTVGWVDREIDAWIDKQIKASRPTDLARK